MLDSVIKKQFLLTERHIDLYVFETIMQHLIEPRSLFLLYTYFMWWHVYEYLKVPIITILFL